MARTAILYIAEKCNQDCVFCLEMDGTWKEFVDPSTQQVHDEVVRLHGQGARHITFMGGETFFRKDLPQIIKRAKEVGFTRVGVTTNGTVLSKAGFIQRLAESGLDFIEMSIHAHTEELALAITRNNVTFSRQVTAMKEIASVRLFTIVNVVICRENKDHLIDVARHVLDIHGDAPVRFKYKFVSLQGLALDGADKNGASALRYDEVDFVSLGDYLESRGAAFWFYNVPLCRLGRHARRSHEAATLSTDETYFDFDHRSIEGYYDSGSQLEGRVWPEQSCAPCTLRPLCPGMEESHRRVAGSGALSTRNDDPVPIAAFAIADRGQDPSNAAARVAAVSRQPRPGRFHRPLHNNSAIRFSHAALEEPLDVLVEERKEETRAFFLTERFALSYLNWSGGDATEHSEVREQLEAASNALAVIESEGGALSEARDAVRASATSGWTVQIATVMKAAEPKRRTLLPVLGAAAAS